MSSKIPLATLLSQALVAFTIEFDNEAEVRLPHRTTDYGRTGSGPSAPWLVSMAMWHNCMRLVSEKGIRLGELRRLARTETNLDGMQRWGYIFLEPDPNDLRAKPPKKDWIVRSTPAGRAARKVWEPLFGEIEDRWRDRFGATVVDELRHALFALVVQLDPELPDCLPIVGYGLCSSRLPSPVRVLKAEDAAASPFAEQLEVSLDVLISRILCAFAEEFEAKSKVSLALSANVLRVLDEMPVRLRDLPEFTGISTPMIEVAAGWLVRHGFAKVESLPKPDRGRQIRLNEEGLVEQEQGRKRTAALEDLWCKRYGNPVISEIRKSVEPLVEDGSSRKSPLFRGLEPHRDGWRAKVQKPSLLPHFPLVTHRGGYPDGS
jgi:hypothetical protein